MPRVIKTLGALVWKDSVVVEGKKAEGIRSRAIRRTGRGRAELWGDSSWLGEKLRG